MGAKDITQKTLEAFDDVFADIVNGLLFKGRQEITESALIDAQPYSMYKIEANLHVQERDVAKYWMKNKMIKASWIRVRIALLGLENQSDYQKDMSLRVIGYDGAAYRAQLAQKDRYPVRSFTFIT